MRFKQWLENDYGIGDTFGGIGGGFKAGADAKALEYAKRIKNGEDQNVVLQGMKQGGAFWNSVMTHLAKLNPQPTQQQVAQPVSLSSLQANVNNPAWDQLYNIYTNQYGKYPNHPEVKKLGQALYQAGTNPASAAQVLAPFKLQYASSGVK